MNFVYHFRIPKVRTIDGTVRASLTEGKGGATVVYIRDDSTWYYGVSVCSPSDLFCKGEGIDHAIARIAEHIVGDQSDEPYTGEVTGIEKFDRWGMLPHAYGVATRAVNHTFANPFILAVPLRRGGMKRFVLLRNTHGMESVVRAYRTANPTLPRSLAERMNAKRNTASIEA